MNIETHTHTLHGDIIDQHVLSERVKTKTVDKQRQDETEKLRFQSGHRDVPQQLRGRSVTERRKARSTDSTTAGSWLVESDSVLPPESIKRQETKPRLESVVFVSANSRHGDCTFVCTFVCSKLVFLESG